MNKFCALLLLLSLAACCDRKPIQIGFLGSTSGRFADLGVAGRNGAQLAIDQCNAAGGLQGRPLALIAEDDKQDPETAVRAFHSLQREGVQAIVGPMTSSMATAVSPFADQAGLVLISPTVTTTMLSGKNDQFFRVVADTNQFAEQMARVLRTKRQFSNAVLLADTANADYTHPWSAKFANTFSADGNAVVKNLEFDSRVARSYNDLAELAIRENPEVVMLITSATDAALLAQKIKDKKPQVALAGAGWGSTNRLLELGGKAVEGMLAEQYYDSTNKNPAFIQFRQRYLKRFGEEPGAAGTLGYDAANVILNALANNPDNRPLKDVILQKKRFAGLQEEIVFDESGDVMRGRYTTFVRNGHFEPLD